MRILVKSLIILFLLAFPVSVVLNYCTSVDCIIVFVVNSIAVMLSFATEEKTALRIGGILCGLLTATFGNAVELIVVVIFLIRGKVVA